MFSCVTCSRAPACHAMASVLALHAMMSPHNLFTIRLDPKLRPEGREDEPGSSLAVFGLRGQVLVYLI